MTAHTPSPLTALAFTREPLLRAIAAGPHATLSALGAASDIDVRNMNKALESLREAGLIAYADGVSTHQPTLSRAGSEALQALDRAAGIADPGHVWLTRDQIELQPGNARVRSGLDTLSIEEMADSIAEKGILQAPTVKPPLTKGGPWRLHMGERRCRGWARAIERGEVPADRPYLCRVFDGDDAAAEEAGLIENLHRSDLDPLEEAEKMAELVRDHGLSAAELARRIGKTEPNQFRAVEERIKVAQDATPENKARYIAWTTRDRDGEAEKFTWTDLRDSVKTPRHLQALDRNPVLAMLIAEMAVASTRATGLWDSEVALAASAATDPTLAIALAVGLVRAYRPGEAELTEIACDWIADQVLEDAEDEVALLAKVRTAALTPLGEAALAPGQWGSAILNIPDEATPSLEPDRDAAQGVEPPALDDDAGAEPDTSAAKPDADTPPQHSADHQVDGDPDLDAQIPDYLRRLAGGGADAAAAPAPVATTHGLAASISPAEHLILLEVYDATRNANLAARNGEPAAPAHDFNADKVAMALPMKAALGFDQRKTGGWLVFLPAAARAYLDDHYKGWISAKDLDAARQAKGLTFNEAQALRDSGRYATAWLNTPPAAEPPAEKPAPSPAPKIAGDIIIQGMRDALSDLWVAAGDETNLLASHLLGEPVDVEALNAAQTTTQLALMAAAQYVPAAVKDAVQARRQAKG